MEAPAPPPPLSATASAVAHPIYPDSVSSSPRSRLTDSCDADAPHTAPPQKLRLMCSYGGHIIPRPHDKTLCYIGGDTRIIVIDRQSSLADLHHRLSKTLLHNQEFSLKYQLPNEDLDSLISVTTDEDLENMVEEYDRLNNASRGLKPGRLRLFLFPTSSSIEQIIVESASTKSEDWFLNALNGGKTTASDRGHSESSSVNCLLGLDDDLAGKSGVAKDVEAQLEGKKNSVDGNGNGNNNSAINQDGHSVPDSPMLETSSSFGSTSSSPSMVNLPPIKVRLEEKPKPVVVGIDEHFQQMTVGIGGDANLTRKKQEEVEGSVTEVPGAVVSGIPVVGGGEYVNRVQVPLQQQHISYYHLKQGGAVDLASPDSISSEGSITNSLSHQRQAIYQEPFMQIQSRNNRFNINPVDIKTRDQNNSTGQMQPQVPESGYVLSSQFDQNHPQLHQQQFVHTGVQYIPAGAVPIASYYPMYHTQQQHHPHQPLLDQQYPVYFMPSRQAQAYTLPFQPPNYNELTPNAPSSRPQMPPSNATAPQAAYNPAGNAVSQLEIAAGMYRTTASSTPVRVPINQNQAQYVGFAQVHHPQPAATSSSTLNSVYEFADPAHAQMYSTQPLTAQMAAQYQTLTPSPAMILPEATAQLSEENLNPQVRTSQP
ncbi:RNA polymerase II degradation factor 1 [Dorcoceras hygrometricum]|uniref:RNA polymerase II degradation factor 1 n=1 Tax=Dorcoceras hygrometricum TaxID=472368 RepID=A0A2Z7AJS6_9LAMI|nr:RNA polymerase II degradation factor 1 [Dorcoceras hygrometricum]